MILILVRHAIAQDRDKFSRSGLPDKKRPLTKKGEKQMKKIASHLMALSPRIKTIYSSPLKRAKQTAKIINKKYDKKNIKLTSALKPSKTPEATTDWLNRHAKKKNIMLVGHEPHLSNWAGYLLSGKHKSFVTFKKGGALAIEFGKEIEAGKGKLLWMMKPEQIIEQIN